ncbi:unnamed protein product [Schistosoma haematobium]|nr:unnamed protein product [Schistosoma haematobium]
MTIIIFRYIYYCYFVCLLVFFSIEIYLKQNEVKSCSCLVVAIRSHTHTHTCHLPSLCHSLCFTLSFFLSRFCSMGNYFPNPSFSIVVCFSCIDHVDFVHFTLICLFVCSMNNNYDSVENGVCFFGKCVN